MMTCLLSARSRLATTNHAPNNPKIAPDAPSAVAPGEATT